jgi:hypothetical protein
VLLSQRVHLLILDKALTLELAQFEDSEFYDKLNRARQEASILQLSFVNRTFALAQNGIAIASYAGLLLHFPPWAVAILVAAGLPSFIAETKSSGERFRATPTGRTTQAVLLATKTLLFAAEGWGGAPALRALDKATGEVLAEIKLPGAVGSVPMSYAIAGKQYVVLSVAGERGAEIVALSLP